MCSQHGEEMRARSIFNLHEGLEPLIIEVHIRGGACIKEDLLGCLEDVISETDLVLELLDDHVLDA